MNIFKKAIRYYRNRKSEYFFGFGADTETEMIEAVIGRKPEYITPASLHDYQLCIQELDDISAAKGNPREILRRAWGDSFKSYTIRQHKGETVSGSIFKITGYERRMLDAWELVPEGWQDSIAVKVTGRNGKTYRARTQRLPKGHNHSHAATGLKYTSWLMPKKDFMRIAHNDAKRYESYVY